jgi:hypothetical protein
MNANVTPTWGGFLILSLAGRYWTGRPGAAAWTNELAGARFYRGPGDPSGQAEAARGALAAQGVRCVVGFLLGQPGPPKGPARRSCPRRSQISSPR